MIEVAAIGELLIDMTPEGRNANGAQLFSQNAGGAPANVLAMCAKLGRKTSFIGKEGDDAFGRFLRQTLHDNGIGTQGLVLTQQYPTTLAFVHLADDGERDFSFYRNPGADITLHYEEVDKDLVRQCGIFHFGSVSLTGEPSRSATLRAVRLAKEAGRIISFDPNYRAPLWKSKDDAVQTIWDALPFADIVKVSEREMELLTGKTALEQGGAVLAEHCAGLVLVTLGERGAYFRSRLASGLVESYAANTVDTTGAGDAFLGAVLHKIAGLSKQQLVDLSEQQLQEILAFANAAGSLTTEKTGAMAAMPTLAAICERRIQSLSAR